MASGGVWAGGVGRGQAPVTRGQAPSSYPWPHPWDTLTLTLTPFCPALAAQEVELAKAEMGRLREELSSQASSKVQLQQLLERMQEMQVRRVTTHSKRRVDGT